MTINDNIPVTDVDQVFPSMVDRSSPSREVASRGGDLGPVVNAALRDVLGWRPRVEDPKAFVDALTASFRLTVRQGHVESEYVARGYAVQSDLGAVTGGQASLFRRAQISRAEILRILDALTPLRQDADSDDMESYRTIIRGAVQGAVDEMGAAGGPRAQMIDAYFLGLIGERRASRATPDQVRGYLGVFRERAGLTNANVNTPDEEGIRTAFWTLTEMVIDLQHSWLSARSRFSSKAGEGFLGTALIRLSRLMEAAVDQVDELEAVLDSVLISQNERRTIMLNANDGLTLDGLLSWLRSFLSHEARHLAQDAGRDAIVSVIAPTSIALMTAFKHSLADPLAKLDVSFRSTSYRPEVTEVFSETPSVPGRPTPNATLMAGHFAGVSRDLLAVVETVTGPTRVLPLSYSSDFPAGMHAARTRIAISSLYRLLFDLASTASQVGRFPGVVLLDVAIRPIVQRNDFVEVSARGLNVRPTSMLAFVDTDDHDRLLLPQTGSTTADEDSVSGLFRRDLLEKLLRDIPDLSLADAGVVFAAEDLPLAVVDRETGNVLHSPEPTSWPRDVVLNKGSFTDSDRNNEWNRRTTERAMDTSVELEAETESNADERDRGPGATSA